MARFYYDFHVHSCLSPCADNDNTPSNIAGMASVSGLDIVALTDHNSARNCPAFFEVAKRFGVVAIAGMELTTSEDIHVVCLFETLKGALDFENALSEKRILIKNRPEIFGEQLVMDADERIVANEEHLLSNATKISIEELPPIVDSYGGVCYPAHIDREANGIISVLGTFPPTPHFKCAELRSINNKEAYVKNYSLEGKIILYGSDAHYLGDIFEREHYVELDAQRDDPDGVRRALFALLR